MLVPRSIYRLQPTAFGLTAPVLVATFAVVMGGCETAEWAAPLDDVLRLDHIQVKGTHNSYHIAPHELYDEVLPAWDYTHADLGVQLREQGVRKLELDAWFDEEIMAHRVAHLPGLDPFSHCDLLTDCLEAVRSFSDEHPMHLPVFVFIETKHSEMRPAEAMMQLDAVEAALAASFPEGRLILPDEVQGGHDSLLSAVSDTGWPTLGEVRGRVMAVLLDSGPYRDFYTEGETTLAGRKMFAAATLGTPIGVVASIGDPIGGEDRIREAVLSGILVRTRSDSPGEEALRQDTDRRDAALRSGAHIISTDYPVPVFGVDYVLELPGVPHDRAGRCNPVGAPSVCSQDALEP